MMKAMQPESKLDKERCIMYFDDLESLKKAILDDGVSITWHYTRGYGKEQIKVYVKYPEGSPEEEFNGWDVRYYDADTETEAQLEVLEELERNRTCKEHLDKACS